MLQAFLRDVVTIAVNKAFAGCLHLGGKSMGNGYTGRDPDQHIAQV